MQSADSWATVWPPLTLSILATIASRRAEIDLFDGNVEPGCTIESATRRVAAFKPDIVVMSPAFPALRSDIACAKAIKQACPDALIVGFGGVFTLLDEEAMLLLPDVDVGIQGEPEDTFEALLDGFSPGRGWAGVAGLLWRDGDSVRREARRPYIRDLDRIPRGAHHLLNYDNYRLPHNGKRFALMNLARGCPHECIYCIAPTYYGKDYRAHSIEYVIEELRWFHQRGIRDFLFWEEFFTLDKPYALALCDAILKSGLNVRWSTTTRADTLDLEMVRSMKRAGCDLLGMGIESADQGILNTARKHTTLEAVRRGVSLCREVGLRTMGHIVIGLPGETPETVRQTIEMTTQLGLDYVQCYPAVPFPKTKLGEMAAAGDWVRSPHWEDRDFGGRSIMDIGTISPEEVDRARVDLYRNFYLRPRILMREAVALGFRPRQIMQATRFLRWIGTDQSSQIPARHVPTEGGPVQATAK